VAAPSLLEVDVSGVAHANEGAIEIDRAPDGIRFEPLPDDAEYLYSLVGWDEKFAAHNAAMWKQGLLVRVPRGVVLETPLYVRVANATEGGSLFWRLLVVAEPESRFALIEEYASAASELGSYSNAAVEIVVQEGAKVEYVSVQNLSRGTWHFASHHARVERDAELDWVAGGFGSAKGKVRIQNDLAGPGATSRVTGAYFADGTQHLDYDTFQEHIAPHTTSDFAFKGALRDTARAVWRGMIRVEEGAQKTNAYQENRNLLLSKTAHADSIPGLEILANDVRCTHGATLGQVDREQLFYLMTRGLTREEAERLIVRGFFQDVLDRVELEPVREGLAAALEARIPQA
jgi:Fe-S cluster assembly protein SufD